MATGNALVIRVPEGKSPQLVQEQLPIPFPGAGQVQVKVSHVAQNPTDGGILCPIQRSHPTFNMFLIPSELPTPRLFPLGHFGDREGNLCTVRPGKANTEHVTTNTRVTDMLVWTAFLKDHRYAHFHWPASKEDHELASDLFNSLSTWLEQGKIKPNRPKVLHGLGSVTQGFQEYRDGTISAYKIVYEL
ncbi:hypothetical protein N7481_005459 [Penicillium waksmanii]|uniref:uncharacterized protein n=1 Tax=Penicillium waksmanii TaxID=69791 RepID=UPI0025483BE1|nr:uncharacterized protein N7481_005459 [Penicillium waksmanii]KAJ5983360.1 hypothetical protein N7481_005459 [Penicillium waksmanii]